MQKTDAYKILRDAGIMNPYRLVDLINKTIASLNLDLSNFVVLTEAASNFFVVTPVIAALSGAKRVIALTQDSQYAKAEEVITQTRALEILCDIPDTIEIHTDKPLSVFTEADIITNLGFVRPINKSVINNLKPTAVIPLMYETWEFRSEDIDYQACIKRNIPVLGTNEDDLAIKVFDYSGFLCLKMLFDAQIEVNKSKILIISSDKFGSVIKKTLENVGAEITLENTLNKNNKNLSKIDALVIADYTRKNAIIGDNGDIGIEDFDHLCKKKITIIQFAGIIDVEGLRNYDFILYPGIELSSHRMGSTFAALGPRPVIELHTAGLKVGAELAYARIRGLNLEESISHALANSPAQKMIKFH